MQTIHTPITAAFERSLAPLRRELLAHPVYRAVDSVERLRVFMAAHAFAVWDFMTLVKRLQIELTGSSLPWVPPRHPQLARFINEIVLDEESDRGPNGAPSSHFEIYLGAMREVGADATQVQALVTGIASGKPIDACLGSTPAPVEQFVRETLRVGTEAEPLAVAASFLYGREDVIPSMFSALLTELPDGSATRCYRYYLERHIELDGDHHAGLARELLTALADQTDANGIERAMATAASAIRQRIALWDHVAARIEAHQPAPALAPYS